MTHPLIINYKESYIENNKVFNIIMEYCEGGDVYKKIREKSFGEISEKQVIDWVCQILLSLEYIHSSKIVHRDIKTQNLFLKNDQLILGDFGISKQLNNTQDLLNTYIGIEFFFINSLGTPYYMSPELFNYQSYSFKSDIWSLGCVIYELCNKNHAFTAQSINGLAVKILKGEHNPMNLTYSEELNNVIISLLQIEPEKRPDLYDLMKLEIFNESLQNFVINLMNIKGLNLSKMQSIEDQIIRLISKNVILKENFKSVLEKINNRKIMLEKEKKLENLLDSNNNKSEFSHNFDNEFDESYESSMISNNFFGDLESYEVEFKKCKNLKHNFDKKKCFNLLKDSFHQKEQFDESFEKDSSFEITESNKNDTTTEIQYKFNDHLQNEILNIEQKLITILGQEKFEIVQSIYENFDESDLEFKTSVMSKHLF